MHCLHAILSNKLSRALEARLALGLKPHDRPLETRLHSTSPSPGRRQGFTLISPVVFVAVLLCQPSGENTSNQWLLLFLICKDGKTTAPCALLHSLLAGWLHSRLTKSLTGIGMCWEKPGSDIVLKRAAPSGSIQRGILFSPSLLNRGEKVGGTCGSRKR